MKVYLVTFDTVDTKEERGAIIEVFGIYDSKEKATKRIEQLEKEDGLLTRNQKYYCKQELYLHEIELNQDCEHWLGGYLE